MVSIDNRSMEMQTDFTNFIRRLCRVAVERYGGIRAFSQAIGESESLWQNRLTEGRVVGFDISWFFKVFFVTGDYGLLVPFFRQGKRISIAAIAKLCQRLNHVVLPIFKCPHCQTNKTKEDDSTIFHIGNLIDVTQKLLRERNE